MLLGQKKQYRQNPRKNDFYGWNSNETLWSYSYITCMVRHFLGIVFRNFAVRGCLLKFQTHKKSVSWFVKHFQISNYAKSQILKENGSDVTKIFIAKMLLMDLHQSSQWMTSLEHNLQVLLIRIAQKEQQLQGTFSSSRLEDFHFRWLKIYLGWIPGFLRPVGGIKIVELQK